MTILLHVIVQTLCSLNTTSCATTGSSNKCTASRHFPQMGKRYEAQGSWVNWAKLASEVEGEDLAAEGSMNRLAQICHSSIFVWTFSLLLGILGQLHVWVLKPCTQRISESGRYLRHPICKHQTSWYPTCLFRRHRFLNSTYVCQASLV